MSDFSTLPAPPSEPAPPVDVTELQAENDRLRKLLTQNGIDMSVALDPHAGIVGNLADLQRLGKLAVMDGTTNVDDAVVIPPKVDPDTGEQTEALTVSGTPAAEAV